MNDMQVNYAGEAGRLIGERNRLIEVGEALAHAAWEAYMEGSPELLDEFERRHAEWEVLMSCYRDGAA